MDWFNGKYAERHVLRTITSLALKCEQLLIWVTHNFFKNSAKTKRKVIIANFCLYFYLFCERLFLISQNSRAMLVYCAMMVMSCDWEKGIAAYRRCSSAHARVYDWHDARMEIFSSFAWHDATSLSLACIACSFWASVNNRGIFMSWQLLYNALAPTFQPQQIIQSRQIEGIYDCVLCTTHQLIDRTNIAIDLPLCLLAIESYTASPLNIYLFALSQKATVDYDCTGSFKVNLIWYFLQIVSSTTI